MGSGDVKILPGLGSWARFAACKDVPNKNVFHPALQDDKHSAEAKAICATCTVRDECREYAVVNYPKGIWGGCTEADLRRIRAKRRVQAMRTATIAVGRCPGCRAATNGIPVGTNTRECQHCGARWSS